MLQGMRPCATRGVLVLPAVGCEAGLRKAEWFEGAMALIDRGGRAAVQAKAELGRWS